jgi:hypothetical protein
VSFDVADMKFADATPIDGRGHRIRQTEWLISERVGWVELLRLGKNFYRQISGSIYDSDDDESDL